MKKPYETVLLDCLGLKKDESLLIIFDKEKIDIAQKFFDNARNKCKLAKLLKIPIAKVNGEEPPQHALNAMKEFDVQLLITTKSLTHTKARMAASKLGKRVVTMPNVQKETIDRCINIDYEEMNNVNCRLADILEKASEVKITTEKGTDLTFSIKSRKAVGRADGIYKIPGNYGNLPAGETYIAPVEGTANGIFVVDASMASIGKLDSPLKFRVENGFAVEISGANADILSKLIDEKGKNARNIAEFGIGTNPKAKITGNILEDEKVMGTCHIALGNNAGFGGKVDVELHLDGIMTGPTIFIDSKKIMEKGKLLV